MPMKVVWEAFRGRLGQVWRAWQERRAHARDVRQKYSPERAMFEIEAATKAEDWPKDDYAICVKGGSVLFLLCVVVRVILWLSEAGF